MWYFKITIIRSSRLQIAIFFLFLNFIQVRLQNLKKNYITYSKLLFSILGPKLYVKPSTKSNKSIINNAISHCCLAGSVNTTMKNKVLEVLHFFSANVKTWGFSEICLNKTWIGRAFVIRVDRSLVNTGLINKDFLRWDFNLKLYFDRIPFCWGFDRQISPYILI